jgi:hypothetical protein
MSKIALKPNASGTGVFSLEAPNSNTDRTLTLPDEAGTVATVENLPAGYTDSDALDLFNATGTAPVYACRAWVNFNGIGTVSIRDSGNVSSITDNGTGDYTVNFVTAMPDVNYSVSGSCLGAANGGNYTVFGGQSSNVSNSQLSGSVQITTSFVNSLSASSALLDHPVISVQIFS